MPIVVFPSARTTRVVRIPLASLHHVVTLFVSEGSFDVVRAVKVNASSVHRNHHTVPLGHHPYSVQPHASNLSRASLSTHANERLSLRIKWDRRVVITRRLLREKCSPRN